MLLFYSSVWQQTGQATKPAACLTAGCATLQVLEFLAGKTVAEL
jgi:hypothetical protein